jgi:PAS domain S-box-containing protein
MNKDKKQYEILVVEDNPGDYTLIEDHLFEQILAPKIHHAKSYKEVKSLLLQDQKNYDIILLDLSLPDKSGEVLISEIVSSFPKCPIIVLTGYADIYFGIHSLSYGISDYLLKDELTPSSLYKSIIYNIERKKSLTDLEESEKRYSMLFHLSPQPMWVFDIDTLRFLDINAAAIRNYGYSEEEFLSMTIKEIRPVEDLTKLQEALEISSRQDDKFFQGIYRHKKKNSDVIHVDIQSNAIFFKGRKAIVVLANDITERLNYIEAIERQNKKLQEIAWMQSHIVRAPLAKIMGFVNLIRNPALSEAERQESLDYILQSAKEFDGIIKEIVSKTEQIKFNLNKNDI